MAWKSSRREKILIYGGAKSGKSSNYIGLIDFAQKTKTDSHFFIIDNDNASEAIGLYPDGSYGFLLGDVDKRERDGSYTRYSNDIEVWVPRSFDDYGKITEQILERAKPEDWIVLDMISNVWSTMPDWWIKNVYGDDPWDYYKKIRKALADEEEGANDSRFGGLSGGAWEYVGKAYRSLERNLTTYGPCHIMLLATEKEIQARFDKSGEKAAQFAAVSGFQPGSEKDLIHRVHTIMRQTKTVGRDGKKVTERNLTMFGDRDREHKWDELTGRSLTLPITLVEHGTAPRFAWDYLIKVGGWKPVGG